MHRLRVARLRGDENVLVEFFDGDENEAFLLSVNANIKHGLPLSLADREAAAGRVLTMYRQWSDRAIAAATGLSPTTVSAIRRRAFVPAAERESGRVGRDGRVRPVDGSSGRRRASEVIAMRPDASLRAIAREAGISVGTARDVRQRLQAGRDPVLAPQPPTAEAHRPSPHDGVDPRRRHGTGNAQPRNTQQNNMPQGSTPHGSTPQRNPPQSGDWRAVRGNLSSDPAVKYAENGRAFVRWVDGHMVEPVEWCGLVDAVPPHWRYSVAELARSCAGAWLDFAQELEQRARTQSDSAG
ncbi:hypothetical protein [Streptomyces sp. NBC_01506]|uniref:hypothetical protein n=1 Tax=Streptomyces sp. NBC_01506 TaxID=2903887 RepID=UPI003863844A